VLDPSRHVRRDVALRVYRALPPGRGEDQGTGIKRGSADDAGVSLRTEKCVGKALVELDRGGLAGEGLDDGAGPSVASLAVARTAARTCSCSSWWTRHCCWSRRPTGRRRAHRQRRRQTNAWWGRRALHRDTSLTPWWSRTPPFAATHAAGWVPIFCPTPKGPDPVAVGPLWHAFLATSRGRTAVLG